MNKSARQILKQKLVAGGCLAAPGVYDGLSARIADPMNFDVLYLSGYGVSASLLAKPDAGFLTAENMVMRLTSLCEFLQTPLIADADTGFGGIAETRATVRAYEKAGAAGIQLEDQKFPKKCGHTPGREVVPRPAAVEKIAAAVAARSDPDFLIVARTDARTPEGLDEAIARGRAFADAGADVIFIESPETEEEFAAIGAALSDCCLIANMVDGGRSPSLSQQRLAELGFNLVIYPVAAMAAASAALQQAYQQIGALTGDHQRVSFDELNKIVGFEEIWQAQKK